MLGQSRRIPYARHNSLRGFLATLAEEFARPDIIDLVTSLRSHSIGNSTLETDRSLLHQHIAELTRVPRPCESEELELARQYVTDHLTRYGWQVRRHEFSIVNDRGDLRYGDPLRGINLIAMREGADLSKPRLVVGAHLDSRPETPGADDNASGVAALLELARLLGQQWPVDAGVELELVAFDLEENGMLGGVEHARICRESNIDLLGMISLEMLGYCDHRPKTQQLPRALVGKYPDTGNFIAIIGNQNSTDLIAGFHRGAVTVSDLPVETLQVPENGVMLQATRLSDHSPFWDAGYPALMITDTSFMRNPHYHHATDTIETLDFDFLHLVTEASLRAVRELIRNS